ncbi:pitrilysin family protein [Mucilaginibacter sp.]|uniref:M16 family metallopeptidase n=1 Tax=Mucilaginibacter sp. TaxID=1882438 RepID=UPI002ED0A2FB
MKLSILTPIILLLGGISTVYAQAPATPAATSFDVNGIKVIFRQTTKNVVNVRMYYRGGVTNYKANKAGIEDLTLQSLTDCGTKKYSSAALKDTADKYEIFMFGTSSYDYGFVQVNTVSKYLNQAWDLFTETIMNPAFEDKQVELLKTKQISAIKKAQAYPQTRVEQLEMQNGFSGTPYAIQPAGNELTLQNLTSADLKDYYKTLLNKNKVFIVVVGNLTKQEVFEKVLASFSNMPSAFYAKPDYPSPAWTDNKLVGERRDLPTNYITAIMNSPAVNSVDNVPFRLGISALSNTLYYELRTNMKLAFDPRASTWSYQMPYAQMNLSTDKPQEAIPAMINILKNIQAKGVNDEWLTRIKNSFLISTFINDQSAASITNRLGLSEINGGWQYADDFPQLVYMATTDQVARALNTYVVGLRWTYLGNPDAIEGFKIPPY